MDSWIFANCILILICTLSVIFANVGKNNGELTTGDLSYIVQEMKIEIEKLQLILESQGGLIAKLENENELLRSSISKQEDDIIELRMILGHDEIKPQAENADARSDNDKRSRTAAAVNEDIEVKSTHNKIRGVRAAGSGHVAFSTYLSHWQSNIGAKQIVKFDDVITNDGNGYNLHTGIFTVPVTGTYVFFAILNSADTDVTFQLMVDDVLQAGGTARPAQFKVNRDVQATALVVISLNQGASVWVENVEDGTFLYSSHAARWSTFSGFLLY